MLLKRLYNTFRIVKYKALTDITEHAPFVHTHSIVFTE